jgi:multiple sugar transport system permease protein
MTAVAERERAGVGDGRRATAARGPARRRGVRRETAEALVFLAPWIVGFVLFTGGPIVASIGLSLFDWDAIRPARFVGLENYRQLAHDRQLVKSLWNTAVYAALFVPGAVVTSLAMAMLLNRRVRGQRFFRTVFYLPTLTQGVATYTLWAVVFDPDGGPLNRALRAAGVARPPNWLYDPSWVKPALVFMAIWAVGGKMLIFLAGLQNIPRQMYEAAEIDGAGPVARFWNVTVPMLSPTIFFNTVMAVIASFQVFAPAYVLTGEGPEKSSLFYVYYLFNRAFVYFDLGYASAMAWLLFLIILGLTVVQIRLGRRWVHYG